MAGVVRRDGLREAVTALRDEWLRVARENEVTPEHATSLEWRAREVTVLLDAVSDVPPDPPAADVDELARWLADVVSAPKQIAAAMFAEGVLVDAADVRARALEDAADRMPAFHDGDEPEWAITAACRWLRDRAVSEREGTSRPPADTDTGRGQ